MKEIYFINGMPRSGSTLLCNILAQNPEFHVTPTSGLSELVRGGAILFKAQVSSCIEKTALVL